MKTKLLVGCLMLIISHSYSQSDYGNHINTAGVNAIFLTQEIIDKVDKNTDKPVFTSGSPYWMNKWYRGTIIAVNGNSLKDVLLRYNVLEKRIEIKEKNRILKTAEPISEFTAELLEKTEDESDGTINIKRVVFRTGYTSNPNVFFRVIYDGKNKLLEGKDKRIEDIVPYGQAPGKKLIEETTFYIYKNNKELVKIKRTKKSLLQAIGLKAKVLGAYIDTNKLDISKDDDLIKAMQYYDSIDE